MRPCRDVYRTNCPCIKLQKAFAIISQGSAMPSGPDDADWQCSVLVGSAQNSTRENVTSLPRTLCRNTQAHHTCAWLAIALTQDDYQ